MCLESPIHVSTVYRKTVSVFVVPVLRAGDEHHLLRLLASGHVHGDPALGPEADAAGFPLHVLGCRLDGHDVPAALRECGRRGVVTRHLCRRGWTFVFLLERRESMAYPVHHIISLAIVGASHTKATARVPRMCCARWLLRAAGFPSFPRVLTSALRSL